MTDLPSRLRASAQAMNALDSVSLRPSSLALIDREIATRIARELEEAAQALEAQQRDDAGVAQALPAPKLCPRCCQYHGPICPAGVAKAQPTRWCPECRSSGVVGIEQDVCPTCDGTGKVAASGVACTRPVCQGQPRCETCCAADAAAGVKTLAEGQR